MKFPKLNQKNVLIGVAVVLLLSVLGVFTYYPDYEMARVGLQYTESGWMAYTPPFLDMGYTANREYAHDLRLAALRCFDANPSATVTCRALAPYQPQYKTFPASATAHDKGAPNPYNPNEFMDGVWGFDCSTNCDVMQYLAASTTPTVVPPPCSPPPTCAEGTHLYLEGCICVADTVPSATPTVAPTLAPTATPYIPPFASPAPTPPAGGGGQADYLFYLIPLGVILIVVWALKKKRRK